MLLDPRYSPTKESVHTGEYNRSKNVDHEYLLPSYAAKQRPANMKFLRIHYQEGHWASKG